MSEYKLTLENRELTGKKTKLVRAKGLIPSVIYGGKAPILASSEYVATEKVLEKAGYHSPIDLDVAGKKHLAIVKEVQVNPVNRKIISIGFQAITANEIVEATTPVVVANFEESDASKLYHFALTQSIEELDVKAKPANLPKELTLDASKMTSVEDKLMVKDLVLEKGVELADKELDPEQVIASLYDPAAEAAAREAEAAEEAPEAADVPADNGQKPEEKAE